MKPNLTEEERRAIFEELLVCQKNPGTSAKLVKGTLKRVGSKFGVTPETISAIWKRGQQSLADGNIAANISSRKQGNSGRQKAAFNYDKTKAIPLT
jgi:hypothetical protein